ncbi:MAG: hypothetical protein KGL95_13290, partial [Patescibacteria group bacterium]|nr:hypothetical protein [Patescibacteria group bacterium]
LTALTVTGCGNTVAIPNDIPSAPAYLEYANMITNPFERATSVLISGDANLGHASIYQDGTDIYLLTVKHLHPTSSWQVMIPGVAQNRLLAMTLQWENVPNTTASDEQYNAYADGLLRAKIMRGNPILDAIAQNIVTPLTIVKPEQHMHVGVVMSDIGGSVFHMELPNNYYDSSTNLVTCNPSFPIEGRTCHGYSGAGVLVLDSKGNPTGKIIGSWAAGNPESSDEPASQVDACTDTGGYTIPFIRPAVN